MNNQVELVNIEIWEVCKLDILTGEKIFYTKKIYNEFTGLYFRDEHCFFAIYPSQNGPIMYYNGNQYPLNKDLHIDLKKRGKERTFSIEEYEICINYLESKYIGFDAWSEEEDVDLFYQIFKSYKDEKYYNKFLK